MNLKSFDGVFRKAIDLNLQYYKSVGRLSMDYWRNLFAAINESAGDASGKARARSGAAGLGDARDPPLRNSAATRAAAMVMEAEPGAVAQGVFMVENHLDSAVDSVVAASAFKDSMGNVVQPTFAFDPPRVALQPGEQMLVRVTTTIGPELESATRYLGEFTVPGLKGTSITAVVRGRTR